MNPGRRIRRAAVKPQTARKTRQSMNGRYTRVHRNRATTVCQRTDNASDRRVTSAYPLCVLDTNETLKPIGEAKMSGLPRPAGVA
jgi:hypothetical protein